LTITNGAGGPNCLQYRVQVRAGSAVELSSNVLETPQYVPSKAVVVDVGGWASTGIAATLAVIVKNILARSNMLLFLFISRA
jgi:hypothetical protein